MVFLGEAWNNTRIEGVCRKAVCHAYGVSHNVIDKAASNVKHNIRVNETAFSDTTRAREDFIANMRMVAEYHDLELSDEQLAAANIQNSDEAYTLYGWLARHIEYAADCWPSRTGDIHIPNLDKKCVWNEYKSDLTSEGQSYLGYKAFCELWSLLFPNVKKKPMYGVMGHCEMCSTLTDIRNKQTDRAKLERLVFAISFSLSFLRSDLFFPPSIKGYFALHRSAYMAERGEYYGHIRISKEYPQLHGCYISDGMKQSNSHLPWCARNNTFTPPLEQVSKTL